MRILVTGSRGKIGRTIEAALRARGDQVAGYDIRDGLDVRDRTRLEDSMRGSDAIVHLAALLTDDESQAQATFDVTVTGTWNVLSVAADLRIRRVVYMSSVDVLGVFLGRSRPDYLPMDDEHPARPADTYSLAKCLAEEMCSFFAAQRGLTPVCLRPPAVWQESDYGRTASRYSKNPRSEWEPYWEYGVFLDARDLAAAVVQALTRPPEGHHTLLLAAADITSGGRTTLELVHDLMPDVEWRGGPEYETDPFRSLVDASQAGALLEWQPRYSWREFISSSGQGRRISLPWRR